MPTYRHHASQRALALYFHRIALDKLLDNDTPATEKVCSDHLPRAEEEITQEEIECFCNNILGAVENFHNAEMNKFAFRKGEPLDENGLDFLKKTGDKVESKPDDKPKDKTDDHESPKKKRKRDEEPPPEGSEPTG